MKIEPVYPKSGVCVYILVMEGITACVYLAVGNREIVSGRGANITCFLKG